MQFRDLRRQYQVLKQEIDAGIADVISSTNFISGSKVQELEERLAGYVGVKHCITCANGTDALTLAMMVWGVGAGDAVFVPDFTFFSTGEIVSFAGATPVFVDVDMYTFNMSVDSLEKKIQDTIQDGKLNPKVIVPVDLFGLPADYYRIREIAQKYKMFVLEDGAQGFGGQIGTQKACSFGDISTTSFFPAKPLGCYGDGGAVFTDDDDVEELIRSYCVHGKGTMKYDNIRIGMNSRLDTIQAAILLPKLEAFQKYELDNVNKAAELYTKNLEDVVKVPRIPTGYYSSWAQYTIQLNNKHERENLQRRLKESGIPSMIYYTKPMHRQKAFKNLQNADSDYKNTIRLCETVLSLPIHPYLSKDDVMKVVDVICTWAS